MTLRRVGWAAGFLIPAIVISLVAIAYWTPAPHPVHTAGARALGWQTVGGDFRFEARPPAPGTSLRDLRCQAWQSALGKQCPDNATLSQRIWHGADDAPHRLYVPWSGGGGYRGAQSSSVNLEYQESNRTVTIHICEARPLLFVPHADQTAGAEPYPSLSLLVVDTAGITPGQITVVEDFWIQRVTGDEANGDQTIGTVEIS